MEWGAKCYTGNSLLLKIAEIEQLEICLCNYVRVWIANEAGICVQTWVLCTVHGTRKFFNKAKCNIQTRSHGHYSQFKNYFTTVFSAISFLFSAINGIQTDPILFFIPKIKIGGKVVYRDLSHTPAKVRILYSEYNILTILLFILDFLYVYGIELCM